MIQLSSGEHFGENKKKLFLKDAILIEAGYCPEMSVPWHYHENAYFYYHVKGHLAEINKKKDYYCLPGTALFHLWQEPHRNGKFSPDALFFHLEFSKEWFERHHISTTSLQGDFQLSDPVYQSIFRRIYLESKIQDSSTALSIDGLSLHAFASMMRVSVDEKSRKPEWVKKVREILTDSLNENVTLTYLASETAVHPVYLSRGFPKYFGMSFGEYVRRLRIEKSVILLQSGDLSVTEIAFACGFSDQSHFIRSFKSVNGITPFQYRKKLFSKFA
jgi:AraC family transcriptional regulator